MSVVGKGIPLGLVAKGGDGVEVTEVDDEQVDMIDWGTAYTTPCVELADEHPDGTPDGKPCQYSLKDSQYSHTCIFHPDLVDNPSLKYLDEEKKELYYDLASTRKKLIQSVEMVSQGFWNKILSETKYRYISPRPQEEVQKTIDNLPKKIKCINCKTEGKSGKCKNLKIKVKPGELQFEDNYWTKILQPKEKKFNGSRTVQDLKIEYEQRINGRSFTPNETRYLLNKVDEDLVNVWSTLQANVDDQCTHRDRTEEDLKKEYYQREKCVEFSTQEQKDLKEEVKSTLTTERWTEILEKGKAGKEKLRKLTGCKKSVQPENETKDEKWEKHTVCFSKDKEEKDLENELFGSREEVSGFCCSPNAATTFSKDERWLLLALVEAELADKWTAIKNSQKKGVNGDVEGRRITTKFHETRIEEDLKKEFFSLDGKCDSCRPFIKDERDALFEGVDTKLEECWKRLCEGGKEDKKLHETRTVEELKKEYFLRKNSPAFTNYEVGMLLKSVLVAKQRFWTDVKESRFMYDYKNQSPADLEREYKKLKVIPCDFNKKDKYRETTIKRFRREQKSFDTDNGKKNISMMVNTDFIRMLAMSIGIAVDIPRSDEELKELLRKRENCTDDGEDYPGLMKYLGPFFEKVKGRKLMARNKALKHFKLSKQQDKLDKTATLVIANALLRSKKNKELDEWVVESNRDVGVNETNDHNHGDKWGCSQELSDMIITHNPELKALALTVYLKAQLPSKTALKNKKAPAPKEPNVRAGYKDKNNDLQALEDLNNLEDGTSGNKLPVNLGQLDAAQSNVQHDVQSYPVQSHIVRKPIVLRKTISDDVQPEAQVQQVTSVEPIMEVKAQTGQTESVPVLPEELTDFNSTENQDSESEQVPDNSQTFGDTSTEEDSANVEDGVTKKDEIESEVDAEEPEPVKAPVEDEEAPRTRRTEIPLKSLVKSPLTCRNCFKNCWTAFKDGFTAMCLPNHKCSLLSTTKRFTLLIKAFIFLLDLITDIGFMVKQFRKVDGGSRGLGALSLVFIIVPLFVGNHLLGGEVSFQLTTASPILRNKRFLQFLDIIQLKPMFYSLALLSHGPKPLWITTKNFADYSRIRYLERMVENVPETLIQAYVLSKSWFYVGYMNDEDFETFTSVWWFRSTLFSLMLSLVLFPKAVTDKEEAERLCDPEKNDLQFKMRLCYCTKDAACCVKGLAKCGICRMFQQLEISVQSTVKWFIYSMMMFSRVFFWQLLAMYTNTNTVGKWNLLPILLFLFSMLYRWIYYMCIDDKRPASPGSLKAYFGKAHRQAVLESMGANCTKMLLQCFVPNDGLAFNFITVFKELVIPHAFNLFEMLVLSGLSAFLIGDSFLGVYNEFMIEWFAVIVVVNTAVYFLAVIFYLIYWKTIHPDNHPEHNVVARALLNRWDCAQLSQKAPWKVDQERVIAEYKILRKDKGFEDYETKQHGCGLIASCKLSKEKLREKNWDEKAMGYGWLKYKMKGLGAWFFSEHQR